MKIPEESTQLQLGDEFLYVFEVDESGDNTASTGWGQVPTRDDRVLITCHDNWGNEVEIRFYPEEDED